MPQDQLPVPITLHIQADPLFWSCYGFFFNLLVRDYRVARMGQNIRFPAGGALKTDLIIRGVDYLSHMGQAVDIEHDGQIVRIVVPHAVHVLAECSIHRYHDPGLDKSRADLGVFLNQLSREAGLPELEMVSPWLPAFAGPAWETFRRSLPNLLPVFARCPPAVQQMGAQLIHRYAAGRLLLITAVKEDIFLARKAVVPSPVDQARHEAALAAKEKDIQAMAEEVKLIMPLYWIYYYEGLVLPGLEHDPIRRFLPPPPAARHPRQARPAAPEDAPAEPGVQPAVEAAPAPILDQDQAQPVGGLIEILPGNPILLHPRVRFYLGLGAKKVYSTTFFARDDYLAIPVLAASGAILVALVSLHEGHTADYFFRAGFPGDEPVQLLRWTQPAQWTRKRVRTESPDTYIGKVRHDSAPRPRRQPEAADPRPQREAAAEVRWHNGVRRLLAAN